MCCKIGIEDWKSIIGLLHTGGGVTTSQRSRTVALPSSSVSPSLSLFLSLPPSSGLQQLALDLIVSMDSLVRACMPVEQPREPLCHLVVASPRPICAAEPAQTRKHPVTCEFKRMLAVRCWGSRWPPAQP